eukprot:366243-Chlamydomonas_euryale.AAC.4
MTNGRGEGGRGSASITFTNGWINAVGQSDALAVGALFPVGYIATALTALHTGPHPQRRYAPPPRSALILKA